MDAGERDDGEDKWGEERGEEVLCCREGDNREGLKTYMEKGMKGRKEREGRKLRIIIFY